MAQIKIDDLIRLLREHPEVCDDQASDVPPEHALYIEFGTGRETGLDSETLDTVSGAHLVVDVNSAGLVCGIEIV